MSKLFTTYEFNQIANSSLMINQRGSANFEGSHIYAYSPMPFNHDPGSILLLDFSKSNFSGSKWVRDLSGFGNHCYLGGVPFTSSAVPDWVGDSPISNYSLYFNGNTWAACKNTSDLSLRKNMTVEAWYKTTYSGSASNIICKWSSGSSNKAWRLTNNLSTDNKLSFRISSDGITNAQTIESTTNIATDKWIYAAATYDNSEIKLYINGILEASASYSGTLYNADTDISIGVEEYGRFNKFSGSIAGIQVLQRSKSAREIEQYYFGL